MPIYSHVFLFLQNSQRLCYQTVLQNKRLFLYFFIGLFFTFLKPKINTSVDPQNHERAILDEIWRGQFRQLATSIYLFICSIHQRLIVYQQPGTWKTYYFSRTVLRYKWGMYKKQSTTINMKIDFRTPVFQSLYMHNNCTCFVSELNAYNYV